MFGSEGKNGTLLREQNSLNLLKEEKYLSPVDEATVPDSKQGIFLFNSCISVETDWIVGITAAVNCNLESILLTALSENKNSIKIVNYMHLLQPSEMQN